MTAAGQVSLNDGGPRLQLDRAAPLPKRAAVWFWVTANVPPPYLPRIRVNTVGCKRAGISFIARPP